MPISEGKRATAMYISAVWSHTWDFTNKRNSVQKIYSNWHNCSVTGFHHLLYLGCMWFFFFFVVSDSLFTDDTLSLAYEVKTKPERKELQAK